MSLNFWAKLSSDYEKLFETESGYDVIIYAGEEPNVKEIHVHSNILTTRSQYFDTAFSNEWAERNRWEVNFQKTNYYARKITKLYLFIMALYIIRLKNLILFLNKINLRNINNK